MRKQIPILLLTVLLLLFNGCGNKNYNIGGFSMPKFGDIVLDKNLPRISGLKAITTMSEVALEWQPLTYPHIKGYRIFRGDTQSGYKLIATLTDRYASHYVDKRLNPDKSYIYKVSSFTDDGRVSYASSTKTARTRDRLIPPTILDASQNLPSRVKIIWRAHPDRAVNSYLIDRRGENEKAYKNLIALPNRLSVEYIDKDVIPAQRYYYRVRARTFDGIISAPSKTVFGFSKPLPQAIKWIKATDNGAKEIEVIWKDDNDPSRIDHYNVYSSPMKETLFTFLGSTNERKYVDKVNSDGSTRYYKITAVDIDGLESSMGIPATVGQTRAPGNRPIINSATVERNTVYLKWSNPNEKVHSYTVVKKFWDGWRARKIKITDFTSTKFVDTKIKPDIQYTYYVIAVDANGIESLPSREVVLSINSAPR